MVISSIDLKGGHVVQLKNGRDLMLERDDALSLIEKFDRYGEVAIIDLDAAIGSKESTDNTLILEGLLRLGSTRVGGGVHSVKRAKKLIALGAQKVIIGSAAWKANPDSGEILNTDFLQELEKAIGRERIIISVDALDGIIATKGWTSISGIPLIEGAKAAEQYCSELLFTCVEKEGCMQGIDMSLVRSLREAVNCRLVVAGGVSSVEEIAALESIDCDVQLGMALYTGKVDLGEAFIECLNWNKCQYIPVIAQSTHGEVLMQGVANKDAFRRTFSEGKLCFYSRTRGELWTKGETSGHYLSVVRLRADCDQDAVLATVVPHGNTCHKGGWTCWTSDPGERSTLERLYDTIGERIASGDSTSYTATLDHDRVREKVMEEAGELCEAHGHNDIVWEAADLLYFVSVLLNREGVTWQDIYNELDYRHKK